MTGKVFLPEGTARTKACVLEAPAGSVSTGPPRIDLHTFPPGHPLVQCGCFHGLAARPTSCQADMSHSQLSHCSRGPLLPSAPTEKPRCLEELVVPDEMELPGGGPQRDGQSARQASHLGLDGWSRRPRGRPRLGACCKQRLGGVS